MPADPERYRRLAEPLGDIGEADAALAGFNEELGALREKYGLRDVLTIIGVSAKTDDGEERELVIPLHYGDRAHMQDLAGFAFGYYGMRRAVHAVLRGVDAARGELGVERIDAEEEAPDATE